MPRPVNPYRLVRRFTGTVNGHVVHRSLSLPSFSKGRRGDERKSSVLAFSIRRHFTRERTPRKPAASSKSPVISYHGGRGESNRLRGGGAATSVAAAEAGGRREDRAPAAPLHAPVVRSQRHRRGDAEAAAGGGRGGQRRGRGPGHAVLRVAGGLHRELPQEPGLRDHLRPPRHGCVRCGGGGGGDDGRLAVQEDGHGTDRGGDRGVPGRGGLRRHVRVGVQRARQDWADAHPRL